MQDHKHGASVSHGVLVYSPFYDAITNYTACRQRQIVPRAVLYLTVQWLGLNLWSPNESYTILSLPLRPC